MKSYLLPVTDAAHRQRLTEAGVKFFEWKNSIIVEGDERRDMALNVLNAFSREEKPTEYANLYALRLFYRGDNGGKFKRSDPEYLASRENYIVECARRLDTLIQAAKSSAQSARVKLPELRTKYFTAVRAAFLNEFKGNGAALNELLENQFESLRSTNGVSALQCLPGKILVQTKTIYTHLPETGTRIELGQFMLEISLNGQGEALRFKNATRRVDGFEPAMHAPNVFASGLTCMDEIEQIWVELIARFELATAVEIALQYLEACAEDPFLGRYADRWLAAS